ncbi:MAG: hypothetical protein IOC86_05640 [Aestuariivirga sp.]|nr:hypothetical protein [Aestuariivirga sp.]
MNQYISRTACAMFVSIVLCASAAAETGFSGNKEISPADAAAKLLQDPNKGGETGLSDSVADPGSAKSAPGTVEEESNTLDDIVDVPNANPVTVLNCSGKNMVVKAYNSNDTVVIVPFEAKTIANGQAASLKCKTNSCRLRAGTGKATDAMAGYIRLDKGFAKGSRSYLKKGC